MYVPERIIEASTLSEVSLCKNKDMSISEYDIDDQLNGKTVWINTFLATEKVCIWMSPEGVIIGSSDWLQAQIKQWLSVCCRQLYISNLVQSNRGILGCGGYLRLIRRALSRSSRSLARISSLFSSSSATFSAMVDRLLAFRSKMTAPEYIWASFNIHQ